MIIVLVGRTHSNKAWVANALIKASEGKFEKVTVYTTKPGLDGHTCVSQEQYKHYSDRGDIFYSTTDSEHNKFFVLRSELSSGRDLIYCIDEPGAVDYMDDLGVPYCIVFVDSSTDAILSRSSEARDNTRLTKLRLEKTATRTKQFDKSAEYTMYVNTSLPNSESGIKQASSELVALIEEWMNERDEDDFYMTPLLVAYGPEWSHADDTVFAI